MDAGLREMLNDVEEFRHFLSEAKSERVKNILIEQIKNMENQISKKQQLLNAPKPAATATNARTYEIKNYAWDQSDNFVKLYVTIKGVEAVPVESVRCNFTARSANITALNVLGNNYEFSMKNLLNDVVPEESSFKLKKDTVLLMLRKKSSVVWKFLTSTEQQLQEVKDKDSKWKPKSNDETKDPSESLMDLMRHMYDTGDDNLKRTIAKAWTESREKQGAEGFGGMM